LLNTLHGMRNGRPTRCCATCQRQRSLAHYHKRRNETLAIKAT
jgi:hypothetical protein